MLRKVLLFCGVPAMGAAALLFSVGTPMAAAHGGGGGGGGGHGGGGGGGGHGGGGGGFSGGHGGDSLVAVAVVSMAAVVVVSMAAVAVVSMAAWTMDTWGDLGMGLPFGLRVYDSTPSYYYVPSAPLDYGYYVPTIPDASGYYGSYSMPAPAPAYAVPQDNVAYVDVTVPDPSADIFINGVKMSQKGITRSFFSPSLTPGKEYTYEFKAEWTDGTKKMTQTRDLPVHAGDHFKINLMASSK